MHRFFAPVEECRSREFTLPEPESRHATTVLRLQPGERVIVLSGQGEEILAEIIEIGRRKVRLRVVDRRCLTEPARRLTLIQAVPKARAMDMIIQKAVELGATRLRPVLSERTVFHGDTESVAQKRAGWRQTAIEAAKQCGNPWLMEVEAPRPMAEILADRDEEDLTLVASLQPGARHPREHLESWRRKNQRLPRRVSVWVGPEGDFTPSETGAIVEAGALPITLGPLVLRCETAAVYCLSFLAYELSVPCGVGQID